MRFPPVLALLLAAPAARADDVPRPRYTLGLDFAVGTVPATNIDDVAAPAGHFDLGRELGDLRLAAELDVAMLTDGRDHAPGAEAASGSFTRLGAAVRWSVMDLDAQRTGLRLYVEAGTGHEWISLPGFSSSRNDLALGFGFSQAVALGGIFLGGHTGLRVLVANAEPSTALCRGTCSGNGDRLPDVALFYTLGMVIGR